MTTTQHTTQQEDQTMTTFTVYGVPKDQADDMTDGRGIARLEGVTEAEAEDYAYRNDSPDNPERYEVREDEAPTRAYRFPGRILEYLAHGSSFLADEPAIAEAFDKGDVRRYGRHAIQLTAELTEEQAANLAEQLDSYAEALESMTAEEREGERPEVYRRMIERLTAVEVRS